MSVPARSPHSRGATFATFKPYWRGSEDLNLDRTVLETGRLTATTWEGWARTSDNDG